MKRIVLLALLAMALPLAAFADNSVDFTEQRRHSFWEFSWVEPNRF